MKNKNALLLSIMLLSVGSVAAQDLQEERGYIKTPNFIPSGLVFTDNYASTLYLVKEGQPTVLVSSPGCGYYYTLSPDQRLLGFKYIAANGYASPAVIDPETGEIRLLHEPVRNAGQVSFTADGRSAYTIDNYLYISDGRRFNLGSYVNIAPVSPDGKMVAFNDADDQIWIMDLGDSRKIRISDGTMGCYYPQWSGDSRKLLFSGFDAVGYVYDLDRGSTYTLGEAHAPTWSDDSQHITFYRKEIEALRLLNSDIYTARFDGSEINRITQTTDMFEMEPRFVNRDGAILYHDYDRRRILVQPVNPSGKSLGNAEVLLQIDDSFTIQFYDLPGKSKSAAMNVPYLHQVYDMPDWFWGYYACAPTTAAMLLAYYKILPEWETFCHSTNPGHISYWGRYVCERYFYRETDYRYADSPNGHTAGQGGYGYMWGTGGSPNSVMADYYKKHGLTVAQAWNTEWNWSAASNQIQSGNPFTLCVWLTGSGHLVLGTGIVEGQHTVICNDPYGNKNTPGYPSYDGLGAVYDWPGYNHGNVNLASAGTGIPWTIAAQYSPIAGADTLVDDFHLGRGFYLHTQEPSSMTYWKDKKNGGYNNHFWWTNSTNSIAIDTCYATWTPVIPDDGYYEVMAFIPALEGLADLVYYSMWDAEGETQVAIDQSGFSDSWVSLGIYILEKGVPARLRLGDATGHAGGKIVFDAVKWVYRAPLQVDFSADVLEGTAPLTVRFTGQADYTPETAAWLWDFGDGGTASVQNPLHIYRNPGNYTVTMRVTYTESGYPETKSDFITVTAAPPGDFALVYPENNSTVLTRMPLFYWTTDAVSADETSAFVMQIRNSDKGGSNAPDLPGSSALDPDIEKFRLFYHSNSDFRNLTPIETDSNYYRPESELIENGEYFWQVEAVTISADTLRSAIWSFKVNSQNSPPAPFTLMNPITGQIITDRRPTFRWQAADDLDIDDAVSYRLTLGTGLDNLQVVYTGEAASYTPSATLLDNNCYYWTVEAIDRSFAVTGNSGGYAEFFINTENDPPSAVSLITPTPNSIETDSRPLFQWTPAVDPDPLDEVNYRLHFWLEGGRVYSIEVDTVSYQGRTLGDNKTWYWTVESYDNSGSAGFADTLRFYRDTYPEPPKAFVTLYPPEGEQFGGNSVEFRWHPATDPDPLDRIRYRLTVTGDWYDPSTYQIFEELNDTTLQIDLQGNSSYSWLVEAVDKDEQSTPANDGQPLHFRIDATGIDPAESLPETYALHRNYPNPFNPATVICYDLPEHTRTLLTIYDIRGNRIRTLVNRLETPGFKSAVWDATDDSGKTVGAGIYIYRLDTGPFSQSERMLLLK